MTMVRWQLSPSEASGSRGKGRFPPSSQRAFLQHVWVYVGGSSPELAKACMAWLWRGEEEDGQRLVVGGRVRANGGVECVIPRLKYDGCS